MTASDEDGARQRVETLQQLENRRRTLVAKLDCGYEDLLESRISDEFRTRKRGLESYF